MKRLARLRDRASSFPSHRRASRRNLPRNHLGDQHIRRLLACSDQKTWSGVGEEPSALQASKAPIWRGRSTSAAITISKRIHQILRLDMFTVDYVSVSTRKSRARVSQHTLSRMAANANQGTPVVHRRHYFHRSRFTTPTPSCTVTSWSAATLAIAPARRSASESPDRLTPPRPSRNASAGRSPISKLDCVSTSCACFLPP